MLMQSGCRRFYLELRRENLLRRLRHRCKENVLVTDSANATILNLGNILCRHATSAMTESEVCIVAVARTPIGVFQGVLSSFSATELASLAIKEILQRAGIRPSSIDEAFIGNVLSANLGQAPARQACSKAGLSSSLPCTTVNKVCASGMKAIMLGVQSILCGNNSVVLAGGMESMSNVPYYLPNARFGLRMGHGTCIDGLIQDGLWDPYNNKHMGTCAEDCAERYNLSREMQDEFAIQSFEKAAAAVKDTSWEIVPVAMKDKKTQKETVVSVDEGISKFNKEKLKKLKSAFVEGGSITAGNSSQISDGAAMVLLASRKTAKDLNLPILASIVESADAAQEPGLFPTTPSIAVKKLFTKLQDRPDVASLDQVDLFEINEAFSAVVLANQKILSLDPKKVNVHGGAIAVGHPLGCSGSRILITLLNTMRIKEKKFGVAAICNGGGGASCILLRNEES